MSKHVSKLLASCTDPNVGATLIDLMGEDLEKGQLGRLGFEVSPGWARMIRGRGQHLAGAAASSPSSPDALDVLAFDSRLGVRRLVAQNPNTSAETLERLFRWGAARDDLTAKFAFANKALPPKQALELFHWSSEHESFDCPVEPSALLERARDDLDIFAEVFRFLLDNAGYSAVTVILTLPVSDDDEPAANPTRPVVFADLFPGGPLEGLVEPDLITEVLKKHANQFSTFGLLVARAMVDSGFPLESAQRSWLTRRACVEMFHHGGVHRTWAVTSPRCPPELVWSAVSARQPVPAEVGAAFERFADLERPSELATLFAAARRAVRGGDGRRIPLIDRTIDTMVDSWGEGEKPAPRPKLALEMCRFSDRDVTSRLLPLLPPRLAAQLWDEPLWALVGSHMSKLPERSPARLRSVLTSECDATVYLLLHTPGMVPVWVSHPTGWRTRAVFELLHNHLGDDAEAWRFAVSLMETWEGTFAELVEVAAAGSGLECSVADPSEDPSELLSECAEGVLPLVFAD